MTTKHEHCACVGIWDTLRWFALQDCVNSMIMFQHFVFENSVKLSRTRAHILRNIVQRLTLLYAISSLHFYTVFACVWLWEFHVLYVWAECCQKKKHVSQYVVNMFTKFYWDVLQNNVKKYMVFLNVHVSLTSFCWNLRILL